MKKSGIELIVQERKRQLDVSSISFLYKNIKINQDGQLADAAEMLICKDWLEASQLLPPDGWDKKEWKILLNKSYKERLIIAGSFIAAEIDRIEHLKI